VCNHPELFERAEATFPFACCRFGMTNSLVREGDVLTCNYSVRGVIAQTLPKLCYRDGGYRWAHRGGHADTGDTKYLDRLMNIWRKDYIHESSWEEQGKSLAQHAIQYLIRVIRCIWILENCRRFTI
jgi:DNA helicase INO80